MKTANIYFDGRIYEGCEKNEWDISWDLGNPSLAILLSTLSSHPLLGIHNFKNGQEVVEGKDYEIEKVRGDNVTDNCGSCDKWMTQQCPLEVSGSKPTCSMYCDSFVLSNLYKKKVTVPTSPLPLPNNEAGEKAKELFSEFLSKFPIIPLIRGYKRKDYAKECCLVCIDEILDVLNKLLESGLHNDFGIMDKRGELQSVREAVNKL